ncbi:MAG: metallophosphoesterase [Longimicrobiaceae bacterium]
MSSPPSDESPDLKPKVDLKRPRCKPRPATFEALGFERQPMVSWLDPGQLLHTIYQSQLAGVFGSYADRREVQAALAHEKPGEFDYDEEPGGELWIDYVADVGEGFASTYTLAWLLAQEKLPLPGVGVDQAVAADEGGGHRLPRGRILVMGGDEVYPTPGKDGYHNRMAGPYDAAFPCLPDLAKECPHLYAIPGNHDWYDGLTSFLRQFCQQRAIGAWKTRQRRSYWALKLPNRWWLWGTDIQLGADIDSPQLDYFYRKAKEEAQPGDRVILCTAEPSWVGAGRDAGRKGGAPAAGKQGGFDNLEFFERAVIRKYGLVLAATLTGDAHHYARYSYSPRDRQDAAAPNPGEESVQKITAGGGAAHLSPTHHLPDCLPLAFSPVGEGEPECIRLWRRVEFPEQKESRRLLRGLWRLGGHNPGMANLLGGVYAALFLCLFCALLGWNGTSSFLAPLSGMLIGNAVFLAAFVFLALLAVAGLSEGAKGGVVVLVGVLHALVHVGLVLAAALLLRDLYPFAPGWGTWGTLIAAAGMFLVGRYLGIGVMALYFWLAEKVGVNTSEALAAQSIDHYKNFLRLHFAPDGTLTVYPFGIHRTVRTDDWVPAPEGPEGAPLLKPKAGQAPRIHLIEQPIVIPWSVQPPYPSADPEEAAGQQAPARVQAPKRVGDDKAPVPEDDGDRKA